MDIDFVPLIRIPMTDLGASILSHQQFGNCAKIELKAMSCLEAYGKYRGKEKCAQLIEDYQECFTNGTQVKRAKAMRLERLRQYWSGERKKLFTDTVNSTSI
ncbi:NADH dehydrogenase (ubiquinone) 15 kDa subunit [Lycorma delicatula]|uniref:NADH dehydrogenase (ubiquinone) 15 kDa subunit n=1 Tax=Lycorma delicatula TaxID=130591 RepID=UPI003F5137AE